MKRQPNSVLSKLIPKPQKSDKPLPLPEGLVCLRCSKNGAMCNRACRRNTEVTSAPKRVEPER